MRGCTPGLVRDWPFWSWPQLTPEDPPEYEPEEGDILTHRHRLLLGRTV